MGILISLVAFLLTSAGALQADPLSGADDASIRGLIQHYVEARNRADEGALRQLFTQDADQLVSTGQWRRGLNNLMEGAMASSRKENGKSSVTLESVRLLGPDAALADGRYETAAAGVPVPRKMWSTFVLQRTANGWRIAAIRNMLPAPALP